MNNNLALVNEIFDTSIDSAYIGRVNSKEVYKLQFSLEGNCEMKIVLKDLIKNKTYQVVTKNNRFIEGNYHFTIFPHIDSDLMVDISKIDGRLHSIELYKLEKQEG